MRTVKQLLVIALVSTGMNSGLASEKEQTAWPEDPGIAFGILAYSIGRIGNSALSIGTLRFYVDSRFVESDLERLVDYLASKGELISKKLIKAEVLKKQGACDQSDSEQTIRRALRKNDQLTRVTWRKQLKLATKELNETQTTLLLEILRNAKRDVRYRATLDVANPSRFAERMCQQYSNSI